MNVAAPLSIAGPRSFSSVANCKRSEIVEKLDRFYGIVFCANWADYLYLVYNVPSWEVEYESLSFAIQSYLDEAEVGEKGREKRACHAHLRIHGHGLARRWRMWTKPTKHRMEAHDSLLTAYPSFKHKVEQTAGHGPATLQSKHKFRWSSMHCFFY